MVDPQRLVDALIFAGFTEAGRRTGVYVRLRWPGQHNNRHSPSLIVPLDQDDPLLDAALTELRNAVDLGTAARAALETASGLPSTITDRTD